MVELVAGERRTRASLALALFDRFPVHPLGEWVRRIAQDGIVSLDKNERAALATVTIPVQIRTASGAADLQDLHIVAVMENLEHANLNALEEARGFKGLIDAYGWSQRDLASKIGRSQGYVQQRLSLLGAAPEVLEAMTTHVFSVAHARAIAAVPAPLQPAVTEWAKQAIQKEDSPATTRQVENRARAVAAFVDPKRWEPQAEQVYKPEQRNRLLLMQWAVKKCDLTRYANDILSLTEYSKCHGWQPDNLLTKKPVTLADDASQITAAANALGQVGVYEQILARFAGETGRTCAHCQFKNLDTKPDSRLNYHCPKQKTTCDKFIGPEDPVIIPIYAYEIKSSEVIREPFRYMTDITDYCRVYTETLAESKRQAEQAEKERKEKHVMEIRAFQEWQRSIPAYHGIFHGHDCTQCIHYQPLNRENDLPECSYVRNPIKSTYYGGIRAPEFMALANESIVLPRCEKFTYLETPKLAAQKASFASKDQALRWISSMGKRGSGNSGTPIPGFLSWLNYGNDDSSATDWDKLFSYLTRNWERLGGDGAIATLIDLIANEARIRYGSVDHSGNEVILLDPTNLAEIRFAFVRFDRIQGKAGPSYGGWPEGFIKPWKL
jgi:ParB-like chromosome segregation protein Spo0J